MKLRTATRGGLDLARLDLARLDLARLDLARVDLARAWTARQHDRPHTRSGATRGSAQDCNRGGLDPGGGGRHHRVGC
jgi:hypothetical protein